MSNSAELHVDGKVLKLDILQGTEGERAVDIKNLRQQTGLITYDPGYMNTGACQSKITFIDGEKGILHHRGYQIDDLAENSKFIEVAYLLMHGDLPTQYQLDEFKGLIEDYNVVHPHIPEMVKTFPKGTHPMAMLGAMVYSLAGVYPEFKSPLERPERVSALILAQFPILVAYAYRSMMGLPLTQPDPTLLYCHNFLSLMFGDTRGPITPMHVAIMNKMLILHADHEQNCSTSTVRMVGSSGANLFASIAGGIAALWGPLHGGANQAVMEMLEGIHAGGGSAEQAMERAKNKDDHFRLMGFGHRVYKTYDPRARIAKACCDEVLKALHIKDPLLEIAKGLEERALNDKYFIDRHLYPNVDFYTGLIYRAMGFPSEMFTPLFAFGRLPGWLSQWYELLRDPEQKIGRPRQIYQGSTTRKVQPLLKRG